MIPEAAAGNLRRSAAGVQFQAEFAETVLLQATVYHLKGCRFLCHKQHRLFQCEALGDDIGDGLAFAGSRRPDQHEILAFRGCDHSGQL